MKKIILLTIFVYLFFPSSVYADSVLVNTNFNAPDNTTFTQLDSNWVKISGYGSYGDAIIRNNVLLTDNDFANYRWVGQYPTQDYKICVDADVQYGENTGNYALSVRSSGNFETKGNIAQFYGRSTPVYTTYLYSVNSDAGDLLASNDVGFGSSSRHIYCNLIKGQNSMITFDGKNVGEGISNDLLTGAAAIRLSKNVRIYNIKIICLGDTCNGSPLSESKIEVNSTVQSTEIGKPFKANIVINSFDKEFNAAQATVNVSPNLRIEGISQPADNSCNLHYTKQPTKEDLSFAGAIMGSSATSCNVYTIVLTPTAVGEGTISLSNGSILSYLDNAEIISGVQNSTFTITDGVSVTPVPDMSFAITSPLKTYDGSYVLKGTKADTLSEIVVNSLSSATTYPTNTTWEYPTILTIGANNFLVYGKDAQGNQTATQNVNIERHTLGDINGDGVVDLTDASLFAVDWSKTSNLTYNLSDMNSDALVNLTDLSILAKYAIN